MLEYALVLLLAPLASTDQELTGELLRCRAIPESRARLECYDRATSGLEGQPVAPAVVEAEPASPEEPASSTGTMEKQAKPEPPAQATPAAVPVVAPSAAIPTTEKAPTNPERAASPAKPAQATGRWILNEGTTTASAKLPAVENSSRRGGSIELEIRCQSDQTSVVIHWGEYLRSESPSVTTRMDSRSPVTGKWNRTEDKQVAIYWPGTKRSREQEIKRFVLQLLAANKLAARVQPSGATAVTAVFDLAGAAAALQPVRRACGW